MKIDRRTFLSIGSFVIGGAAGTALSPLPWKITDDLSIWTQMWPWTPVPEDGEINYTNSVCTLCPGGCGISVRKVDERAVKIEGMAGHPVNDGGICILGLAGLQLLYGPSRIKSPLKRVGERGEGKWEKISWSAAISELAQKLAELRKDKPQSVACISGSKYGTMPQLLQRFMTAYGSPNFMTTASMLDSYKITLQLMHGVNAMPGFDIENAGFVLSFGSGIIDGWGSPVRMFKANSTLREKKATVVQIEPRLSNTAAKSDKWIPVKPGSEAVLALGLASVIIKESLYNKEFVDTHTEGFEAFKKLVLTKYSPAKVAPETGLEASQIVNLAKQFAGASNPLAICGRGQGDTPGSLHEFMAVHTLNALVGNINKKGGVWAVPDPNYIQWAEVQADGAAQKGLAARRVDGAGSDKYPCSASLINGFVNALSSAEKSPVEALLVWGANPYYTLADTASVKKAFASIPYIVSFSSFMDETAQNADLILPNHTYLECYEDIPAPVGLNKPVIGISRPVVKPQFDTKHTGDVILQLAGALKGSVAAAFPWKSYEACLKETFGDKWGALSKKCFLYNADYTPPAWDQAFQTPSHKFEFFTAPIRQASIEGDDSYPLVLVPYDSIRLANDYIANPPFLTKTVSDNILKGKDIFVEVNPATGNAQGLKDGGYATLTTPRGKAKVKVCFFDGIMPGIIAMPKGLGHTAYDKYLAEKGVNINELIGPVEDPVSGLDAAWGIRAKLNKA